MLGSRQLALACDELALWLGLYMFFENPSGVFTNKACCLWIAVFLFYVFHRLRVVFDVLTYMCLVDWCQIKQIIPPICG